ncbi:hypothetical protein J5X84_08180 [Streptosporangiaceae bacterium NEAU-GS5]|nr:hypothetical protein [Streptosporangiaceae bacterium NEAU-GS5]
MAFLWFLSALLAIVVFAVVVNRLTGTKAQYLEGLQLQAGEQELWRDTEADFAVVPRMGRAALTTYPRLRRHTVLWTNRRVVISQKALGSAKHMITHQVYFGLETGSPAAADEAFGGFYGRGFQTIAAVGHTFGEVNGKACARIRPTAASGSKLNLDEALIFSDKLDELRRRLG